MTVASVSSAASGAAASVQKKLDEREKALQAKWRGEVMGNPEGESLDAEFKNFDEWSAVYAPKKEEKEAKKGGGGGVMASVEARARASLMKKVPPNSKELLLPS